MLLFFLIVAEILAENREISDGIILWFPKGVRADFYIAGTPVGITVSLYQLSFRH